MKCVICNSMTRMGSATVVLERGTSTIVFKGVPALVCENCGEEYLSESVTARILELAELALREGVEVDVRHYVAA